MTDERHMEPEESARVTAALDQLLAALSDITGTEITSPIIVLARVEETDGLCLFNADVPPEDVSLLLTTAALNSLGDLPLMPDEDPE